MEKMGGKLLSLALPFSMKSKKSQYALHNVWTIHLFTVWLALEGASTIQAEPVQGNCDLARKKKHTHLQKAFSLERLVTVLCMQE